MTRTLWLDFDHRGFTVVDNIQGAMRRDWRLDMQAPFALKSARQNNDQLLVTEGADGRAGVELRQPQLNLTHRGAQGIRRRRDAGHGLGRPLRQA